MALTILLVNLACFAGEKPSSASKHDRKLARKDFEHGLQLQKAGLLEDALSEITAASGLEPENMDYIRARELLKQQIAGAYVERGNILAELGDNRGAAGQFQAALGVDPESSIAQRRFTEVSAAPRPAAEQHVLQMLASVDEVELKPRPGVQSFHVRGQTQALYQQIGQAFGITISFDSTLNPKSVRFDVDDVDFYTAMSLAGKITKTFWAPIWTNQAMVASDTQEMRKQYERLSVRTFRINNIASQSEMNDIAQVIRNIFEVRLLQLQPEKRIITVKATKEQLNSISAMLDNVFLARPEVEVEIKAFELNQDALTQYGLNLPDNFQMFNVASEINRVLGPAGPAVFQQILKTGVINPADIPTSALGALQSSPLLQPFILFGKGIFGLTGITYSPVTGHLSTNNSMVTLLEDVTVRASDNNPATMKIGTRFPIQTSSFSSIAVATNGTPSVTQSFPTIQYQDLGVTFKATPHYHPGDEITMDLEFALQALGAQPLLNGNPTISSREYKGNVTVLDGEPAIVSGQITVQTDGNVAGYPLLSQFALFGDVLSTNSKQRSRQEILIVVTPRLVRKTFHEAGSDLQILSN
ncbi:MAG TPA: hypothetical protein VKZ53_30085 [Candidatus Angelobacter sp.]|nr:hypothetical protein [Candidatus Angelobacter sp.]